MAMAFAFKLYGWFGAVCGERALKACGSSSEFEEVLAEIVLLLLLLLLAPETLACAS